jgi:hypothetical protein
MLNPKYKVGDRVKFIFEGQCFARTIVYIEDGTGLSYEDFESGYPCPAGKQPVLYGMDDPGGECLVWEHELALVPMDAIALLSMATA